MANTMNRTKVITGMDTRLSYFHGWEPVSINGSAEKYSVSVLIPKSDTQTVNAINAAIDASIEDGISKFGVKKPNKCRSETEMQKEMTRPTRGTGSSTPTPRLRRRSLTDPSSQSWTEAKCIPAAMQGYP